MRCGAGQGKTMIAGYGDVFITPRHASGPTVRSHGPSKLRQDMQQDQLSAPTVHVLCQSLLESINSSVTLTISQATPRHAAGPTVRSHGPCALPVTT
ncbi:hypothetical protein J6590_057784 [Homalodisca vitripennis]|nr:hypothetical protein J6590_057784 [Homalodisca vitripennis]